MTMSRCYEVRSEALSNIFSPCVTEERKISETRVYGFPDFFRPRASSLHFQSQINDRSKVDLC